MKKKNTPKAYSYIRFSTPTQKHGDSERRQIEEAKKYAKANGLELDQSLVLKDEGLSGYTGKHIKEGSLGKFLKLIEAGKVEKGSRLIIESIDRLGRQDPFIGTDTIRQILEHGIMLVVIDWYEPKEYTYESIKNNPGELSSIVHEVERAYFESKKKADRLGKKWKEKRKQAIEDNRKLTSVCPMWLKPIKDKNKKVIDFEVIEEVASQVRRIFELKEEGYGNAKIAKELDGNWAESTIQRYVSDIRVLGNFQPHTKKSGKREPIGDLIDDYYPSIVDEELFLSVQDKIEKWKEENNYRKGRTGKHNNVFQGRLICGKCGGKMHYDNKGKLPKGGQYVRCSTAKRALKNDNGKRLCKASWVRYDNLFEVFIKFVHEIDLSKLLPNSSDNQRHIENLSRKLSANNMRIKSKDTEKTNLTKSIARTKSDAVRAELEHELEAILSELKELKSTSKKLGKELEVVQNQSKEIADSIQQTITAKEYLESAKTEEEAIENRLRLKRCISDLISTIVIHPSKKRPNGIRRLVFTFKNISAHSRVVGYVPPKSKSEVGKTIVLTRTKAPKKSKS